MCICMFFFFFLQALFVCRYRNFFFFFSFLSSIFFCFILFNGPSESDKAMVRMHGNGHGKAASALPYRRTPPTWLKSSSRDVIDAVCKLAKKGLSPSRIGMQLRDSMGIAQVKNVTGRKILRILKHKGMAPEIPEDLYCLIKRATQMRKHLERNTKDKDTKFRLILVESRIHRLARYYRRVKQLPPTWKYESSTASAMVA
ncbi:40S ribosomal protein S13, putative [Trypanosoma brucei gambiense DAL972]|nr:40S ribosomal protein S13, putative [Trypanosoma brucei gambiense DAL972]CBH09640.1 40S ribosomal protein S13, putative [Trypanosoma brucei gambiense DAL972]|eukprot:XP_011771944.1 40S ribosomal protein S13, putative [Trypanosoma brucei gambiense DAL972]